MGKLPYAGMSLFNLHYAAGLQDLGYDVYYIERSEHPWEYYDPDADAATDDPSCALEYLCRILPEYGIGEGRFSLLDRHNQCHGGGWPALREALGRADFLLTLAVPTWFDEMALCGRRMFVDGDPIFTQAAMLDGEAPAIEHYDTLFTYGVRLGMSGCTIPSAGRRWIPTRPPVATKRWQVCPIPTCPLPVTALLHWKAGGDIIVQGRNYGHKDREFERFVDLPTRSSRQFVLAVGGVAPLDSLRGHGWTIVNPLTATRTVAAYQEFIAGSWADLGIAKHAYVASRSGWFSDRSTCYLASGRPVLHQDTGFTGWLPTGTGVLPFTDLADVLDALRRLELDYVQHARAARRIAEEHFEATQVIGRMLDEADFR